MKYTVVLLRPQYLTEVTDEPYGQDIYVALVEAEGYMQALTRAQEEVFKADKKDKLEPVRKEDYRLCVLFEGHQQPKLYGWQT